jgi:hypothetical protein
MFRYETIKHCLGEKEYRELLNMALRQRASEHGFKTESF